MSVHVYDELDNNTGAKIIYFCFIFVIMILMMNILIAMMNQVYSELREQSRDEYLVERIALILKYTPTFFLKYDWYFSQSEIALETSDPYIRSSVNKPSHEESQNVYKYLQKFERRLFEELEYRSPLNEQVYVYTDNVIDDDK